MKKIIAAAVACLFIVSAFAGCGIGDPLTSKTNSSSSKSSSTTSKTSSKSASSKKKTEKTYEDSFDGLVSYMTDKGYITSDAVKNSSSEKLPSIKGIDYKKGYEYIDAEKGVKYPNNSVVIELYSFKNPDKNECVQSVKKNGSFEIFGIEVKATLAVDGKYMMIYTDKNLKESDTTSDAYKNREKAIEKFEAFSPKK